MNVTSLEINNFRNIEKISFEPCDSVNVIFGRNAQGKTNLLESIWLFTGLRSFRGSKDPELIRFGSDYLRNELRFNGFSREQSSRLIIGRDSRRIVLNDVPLKTQSGLIGNFCCVIFSPNYVSLVRGAPSERRKFIDLAICQTKASYTKLLSSYNKALEQRNAYLKQTRGASPDRAILDVWDEKLAQLSARIVGERMTYLDKIKKTSKNIHDGLSSGKEKLELEYSLRVSPYAHERIAEPPGYDYFAELLKKNAEKDLFNGVTGVGAHKDDIDITINDLSVKLYASQGQQRSAALALKLGEAEIISDLTGEMPVALLDDVMSELDETRQDYILNHIKSRQVFITCCDPETVLRLCGGKTFEVEGGALV